MNILKTSLILYPSVPGGPRPKYPKTYISSEPIVPTYDLPKWVVWVIRLGYSLGVIIFATFVLVFLSNLIEKVIKAIL